MKAWSKIPGSLLALGLLSTGCVEALSSPVTLVPTRTPGVTYVIVRPSFPSGSRATGDTNPSSEYILLCDGRPADGMHCELPTEAALARVSQYPNTGKAAVSFDGGIGTLPDLSVKHSGDEAPTPRAPVTPPPPPPPPPPTVSAPPPTAPTTTEPKKGGSK